MNSVMQKKKKKKYKVTIREWLGSILERVVGDLSAEDILPGI